MLLLTSTAIGVALAALAGAPDRVQAQTWDGDTNTDWNTATNWSLNALPAAGANPTVNGAGGLNANPVIGANTNAYTLTTINGGTVTANATLNSTSVVVSGTGTLNINAPNGVVTGNLTANAGGTVTNNGALTGNLTVSGGTFNNAGIVTGTTSVSGGTLNLNPGTNLADGQALSVSGTGTLTVNAADTVGAVTQSGGTIGGAATLTAASFLQTGGNLSGTLSSAGAKTLEGGTISGTLTGTGLTTVQTGETTLTGTISGGATTINAGGTLAVNGGTVSNLTVSGGTVRGTANTSILGSSLTIGGGSTGTISAAAGTTFTVRPVAFEYGPNSTTIIGSATDTGRIRIEPIISLSLGAGSDVQIAGGTLVIANSGIESSVLSNVNGLVGNREVTINSGATVDINGFNSGIANLTGAGTVTNGAAGAATVTLENDQNSTFSGVIQNGTGTVSVTKSLGGTLTLSGPNTYSGATNINAGALRIANGLALGATGAASGTTVASGAALELTGGIFTGETISVSGTGISNGGAIRNISGGNVITGQITITNATRMNSDGGQLQLDGGVTGTNQNLTLGGAGTVVINSAITTGTGTLTKDGTGVATLYQVNTFTGATTVNAGQLQLANAGGTLSDTALLTVNSQGEVVVFENETVGNIAGTGSIRIDGLGGTKTLTAGDATNSTFSGMISNNNPGGAFVKQGSGTLTLTGSNTFSGGTTVNAGTLTLNNAGGNALLDTGAVTVNGGTLALSTNETIGSLAGTGTVTLGANTLTIGGDGDGTPNEVTTFSGGVSGSGGLTKSGNDIQVLSGSNSYTGTTTVNAGALRFDTGGSLFDTGDLVVNGGTLGLDNALISFDSLSGTGGTIALTATNGASQLAFGSDNSSTSYSGNISTTALTALVKQGTGTTTLSGVISGSGPVVVSGGTLELRGNNSYTGGTTVDAGTLRLNNAGGNALSDTGEVTVNGGTLALSNSETIGSLASAGTVTMLDGTTSGVLTVTGNYTGGGTLALDAFLGGPGSVADKLVVGGATSGQTTIQISDTNIGLGAFNPDGIALVEVTGATAASNFVLDGGPITKGLFIYDLALDGGTHELTSTLIASAASGPTIVVAAAENVWAASTDTWDARQQELRDWASGRTVVTAVADPPSQENMPSTLWLAASGNWNDRDAQGTELGFSQNTYGLTAGADFGTELDAGSALLFGVQAGYVTSDIDIEDGFGSGAELEGYTLGAYATLLSNGFFVQTLADVAMLDTDLAVGAFAAATDATIWGLRADAGYRMEFGSGLFLEPMVSAAVANSDLDSFALAGVTFDSASNDLFWLGGGARLGFTGNGVNAALTARLWNDLSGDNALGLIPLGPALTVSDSGMFDGVFGEVGGKLGVEIGANTSLFGQGQLRFDGEATAVSANAGLTFRW